MELNEAYAYGGGAFGVRLLGTALVVISDLTDFRNKGPEWASPPIIATESKLTTKAVPSNRTPKAVAISSG